MKKTSKQQRLYFVMFETRQALCLWEVKGGTRGGKKKIAIRSKQVIKSRKENTMRNKMFRLPVLLAGLLLVLLVSSWPVFLHRPPNFFAPSLLLVRPIRLQTAKTTRIEPSISVQHADKAGEMLYL